LQGGEKNLPPRGEKTVSGREEENVGFGGGNPSSLLLNEEMGEKKKPASGVAPPEVTGFGLRNLYYRIRGGASALCKGGVSRFA